MLIYLSLNQKVHGPYSLEEVQDLIREGKADPASTPAWRDGLSDWAALGIVIAGEGSAPSISLNQKNRNEEAGVQWQKTLQSIATAPLVRKFITKLNINHVIALAIVTAVVYMWLSPGSKDPKTVPRQDATAKAVDLVFPIYLQHGNERHEQQSQQLQEHNQRLQFELQQMQFAKGLQDAMAKNQERWSDAYRPSPVQGPVSSWSQNQLERDRRRLRDSIAQGASSHELDTLESSVRGWERVVESEKQRAIQRGY